MPGIIDLPSGKRYQDGQIIVTHQNHKYLFMTGISFQALPKIGVSFRYGGQGLGGAHAQGRINWDRSFDAHISISDESKYMPALSLGLRDFIGTGWYSSEYIVGTKTFGKIEVTAGLGYGRLAGRNRFSNPLGRLSSYFKDRDGNQTGKGGTLGTINWFQGETSAFYGLKYSPNKTLKFSAEYTPDSMSTERRYLDVKSPWNYGVSFKLNEYLTFSADYLHGSQFSLTGQLSINPTKPHFVGGKELAPVPMRSRKLKT